MHRLFKNPIARAIAPATLAVLAAIVATLLVSGDTERRLAALQELRLERAARAQAIASLVRLKADAPLAQAYLPALRSLLPDQDQALAVQRELRDLARARGLSFTFSFGASAPATETAPGAIAFQFTAGGPFDDLIAFLEAIEQSDRLIAFTESDVSFSNDTADAVSATVRGRVFTR